MSEHASAWKTLVDEWVARERELYPDAPVQPATVKVRDSIEIGDQAFVLISYDVDVPWPTEEDTAAEHRGSNTAVLAGEARAHSMGRGGRDARPGPVDDHRWSLQCQ